MNSRASSAMATNTEKDRKNSVKDQDKMKPLKIDNWLI